MANCIKFYKISFETVDSKVTDRSVLEFFCKIEKLLKKSNEKTLRCINNKLIQIFSYYKDNSIGNYLVIPIGRLREKNIPYGVDKKDPKKLAKVNAELYDINSLVYYDTYKILMITTNNLGPKERDIEEYLNSFIYEEEECKIKISPIFVSKGMEQLEKAKQVRSLIINLDLGKPLNKFYNDSIKKEASLGKLLSKVAEESKDELMGQTFSIKIGLEDKSRSATLDVETLLSVLKDINLDVNCVKEIIVHYKKGATEKIEKAQLKNSSVVLFYKFGTSENQLSPEYLKVNGMEAIEAKQSEYYDAIRKYFRSTKCVGNDYLIRKNWNDENDDIKNNKR